MMPSLGGCQVQEGCQPHQDLARPPSPSQPYLQPRSVPSERQAWLRPEAALTASRFCVSASCCRAGAVRAESMSLLKAQGEWGAQADGRGDSERLRTGPPQSRAVAEQVPFHAAGCRRGAELEQGGCCPDVLGLQPSRGREHPRSQSVQGCGKRLLQNYLRFSL